ncbi:MAG: NAD(P)-dependent oxidoreductase [Actinomycetota bacterium]|nr:NAD(P)-dependent oxidoreductase [Actinomycetota bacterium]
MAERPTIAFLGTGIMGGPMARNVARAGLNVRAWNRTRERAEALAEDGVEVADSPPAAAEGADVVVTMLTDGDAVAATTEDALPAMRDDAVWAQMSTVGLDATERLAGLAAERGVDYVDAPVLGTRQPAEAGKLVVLAAGPRDAVERCRPVFDAVGEKTVELDEVGQPTRLKLVLNTWVVGVVENLAETIVLARALDLDPHLFLKTIEGGALDCGYAHLKGELMIEESFEPPAFSLRLAHKDASLVLDAARQAGLELPLVEAVSAQFERATAGGHGDEDLAAVYAVLAESIRL